MNVDKPHILVVDDDDRLRSLLKRYLSEQRFIVSTASHTAEANELMRWFIFDLLVLDVMMPGKSGRDWLAEQRITTPVLMLSALGEAEDRIKGLEVGAEDYLSKPFEPKELVLRLRAILRRTGEPHMRVATVRFGPFLFDIQNKRLKRNDVPINLTSSEAELLAMLADNVGKAVSRDKLATLLPEGSNERSVDVQMSRLRKKMEEGEGKQPYLQTVRGAGYMLVGGA